MSAHGYIEAVVIVDVFVDHFDSVVKKKAIYMGIVSTQLLWIDRCK